MTTLINRSRVTSSGNFRITSTIDGYRVTSNQDVETEGALSPSGVLTSVHTWIMYAVTQTYILTGISINFIRHYAILAATQVFTLTGIDVVLVRAMLMELSGALSSIVGIVYETTAFIRAMAGSITSITGNFWKAISYTRLAEGTLSMSSSIWTAFRIIIDKIRMHIGKTHSVRFQKDTENKIKQGWYHGV